MYLYAVAISPYIQHFTYGVARAFGAVWIVGAPFDLVAFLGVASAEETH